jgi:hypothetical protein
MMCTYTNFTQQTADNSRRKVLVGHGGDGCGAVGGVGQGRAGQRRGMNEAHRQAFNSQPLERLLDFARQMLVVNRSALLLQWPTSILVSPYHIHLPIQPTTYLSQHCCARIVAFSSISLVLLSLHRALVLGCLR